MVVQWLSTNQQNEMQHSKHVHQHRRVAETAVFELVLLVGRYRWFSSVDDDDDDTTHLMPARAMWAWACACAYGASGRCSEPADWHNWRAFLAPAQLINERRGAIGASALLTKYSTAPTILLLMLQLLLAYLRYLRYLLYYLLTAINNSLSKQFALLDFYNCSYYSLMVIRQLEINNDHY